MRFRTGLIVGGAVGYYLGARAGHERYEQMDAALERLRRHPTSQRLIIEVDRRTRPAARVVRDRLEDAVPGLSEVFETAADRMDQLQSDQPGGEPGEPDWGYSPSR